MSDLVERLRDGVATEGEWREHTYDGLMLSAADEIERLRKELADCQNELLK